MNSAKEIERRVIKIGTAVLDTNEWCNEEEAAKILGLDQESLMNRVYGKKIPSHYARQSKFSKRWWFWVPAIFGFEKQDI